LLGPETAHSPNAEELNALYWVMLVIAGFLVVAVNAALVVLALRFRGRRGVKPRRLQSRRPAQLIVGSAFAGLAIAVFILGVVITENASQIEGSGQNGLQAASTRTAQRDLELPTGDGAEPLTIDASGQQWIWRYEYPNGAFSYYELVVPVDTAVLVRLGSTDVVHRWWVQGLGGKFDAVPDQSSQTWFKADEEGTYEGASYQFSGTGTATMRTRVRVVSVEAYEAWLDQQAADIQAAQTFVQEIVAAGAGDALGAEQVLDQTNENVAKRDRIKGNEEGGSK
jgi:cytochrome c oxidase subunit 2